MSGEYRLNPEERIAEELRDLRNQITSLQQGRIIIPLLEVDPDPSDPINIWQQPDGILKVRYMDETGSPVVHSFAPEVTTTPSSSIPRPSINTDIPTSRVAVWPALWSSSYSGDGTLIAGIPDIMYGRDPKGVSGTMASQIGFDADDIAATLSGSRVIDAQMLFTNQKTYYASGATLKFGLHSNLAAPSTYTGVVLKGIAPTHFDSTEARWVDLPPEIVGAQLRSGAAKGIVIDQGSDDVGQWGYGVGVAGGSGGSPILKVTYVK